MSGATMFGRDLYMRRTDAAGRAAVSMHRVWDGERFLQARAAEVAAENAEAAKSDPKAPRLASVAVVDRDAYINRA
jgi:hypothetical protein